MKRFKQLLHILFKINLIKTLWFNWKMLPARQAWRLPFYFYGRVKFRSLAGKVILEGKARSGMIEVGRKDYYVYTSVPMTVWTLRGTVIFSGLTHFITSSYLLVADTAVLKFGKYDYFASGLKLFCFDRIEFGRKAHIAWDCQIMDTSFHYLENPETGETGPLTKPVRFGDWVWVGNRSTIAKGSVLPDYTIVASGSLVNRDFSAIGPNCLLAGSPAVKKAEGIRRVFSARRQKELDEQYHYTRTHL